MVVVVAWVVDGWVFLCLCVCRIARQLTLLDWHFYQGIQNCELLNLAWSKEKLQHRAVNVRAMIRQVCGYVGVGCETDWPIGSLIM